MDEDIRAVLSDLKSDVRSGFDKVDQTFKEMVTKGEFNATIARLDAEAASLRRDFEAHDKAAPGHRAEAARKADEIRTEVRTDLEGFRVTTRWAIGIAAGLAGIAASVGMWLLNLIK